MDKNKNHKTKYTNNTTTPTSSDWKQAIGEIVTNTNEDNKTELYFQIYKDRSILNPSLWLAQ